MTGPATYLSSGPPESKLVAGSNGNAVAEDDLDHLLAVDLPVALVAQRGDDLLARHVDDLARGRIGIAAVEAERHPAGLLAELDTDRLPGRHGRGVEDVDMAVGRIADPDFPLVGRQANAVARAAVPLDRSFLKA